MATNEELQQQLDEMRSEMAALRRQLQQPADDERPRLLSRRNLLRAAPVAAVGGAVAALSASPAAATTGQPLLLGKFNSATGSDETHLETPLFVDGDFWFSSVTSTGFTVNRGNGAAVSIQDQGGGTSLDVAGGASEEPHSGPAIVARAAGNVAITAQAIDTPVRFSTATDFGKAIVATTQAGTVIAATSTAATGEFDAVTIDYAGTSRALYAQSHNPSNINGTVTGVNEGRGIGVWGEQRNNSGPGIGVVGVGGAQGRGSQFAGGAAQTRLVPSTAATHPTTGKAGDLFVDASVRLWFCTKASIGSAAATWKQIA